MSLLEKVLKLKLDGAIAIRHALFWEKQINEHGEHKTTEFYKSLGLNHLDDKAEAAKQFTEAAIFGTVPGVATVVTGRAQAGNPFKITINHQEDKNEPKFITAHVCDAKSFQWEGLTLSREPKEHEKLAVKGIHGAQESAKTKITSILLDLRTTLISDGLKGIKKLSPAKYHQLVLETPAEFRTSLRDRLIKVHRQGRLLVVAELGKAKTFSISNAPHRYHFTDDGLMSACTCLGTKEALPEDEFDLLDDLVDITDSRVANDIQSRLTAAATRFRLLGLEKTALWKAVEDEVRLGSVSYIDRAAIGVGNKVLNIGRMDEMRERSGGIDRYEQSALLDPSTCEPCLADDGKTASDPEDLPGGPNPDCLGSDYCRCFVVAITL